jgi:hypothetical protein
LVSDVLIALNTAVQVLKMQIQKNGDKVHLTIFKDFSETQISFFDLPEFHSYFKFSTQPNMLFEIKKHWHSFDDYTIDLIKKYRDQFKRARKKAEEITKRKLSLEDIANYKERIFERRLSNSILSEYA